MIKRIFKNFFYFFLKERKHRYFFIFIRFSIYFDERKLKNVDVSEQRALDTVLCPFIRSKESWWRAFC